MGNLIAKYAFFPPTPPTYDQSLEGLFFISHKNEAIPAVLHTIPDSEYPPSDPFVILFTHGNAEDIGPETQSWLKYFATAINAHVISYDYVGYGLNQPGEPTSRNCYRNIEAVWNYLIDIRKYSPRRIVLLGRSIGSGPTVHLAAKLFEKARKAKKRVHKLEKSSRNLAKNIHKIEKLNRDIERLPGAVILQSPIASCIRVVSNTLATALPFDLFANIKKIHKIQCPVAIVHGTNDQVVPFGHAQLLWKQYQLKEVGQFVALHAADHNNIEMTPGYRDDYIMCVRKLLRDLDEHYGRYSQLDLAEMDCEPFEMKVAEEHPSSARKQQERKEDNHDLELLQEELLGNPRNEVKQTPPTSLRTERHESNSSIRYCTLSTASSESCRSNSSSPTKESSLRSPSMIIAVDEKLLNAEVQLDQQIDTQPNRIKADTTLHDSLDQLSIRLADNRLKAFQATKQQEKHEASIPNGNYNHSLEPSEGEIEPLNLTEELGVTSTPVEIESESTKNEDNIDTPKLPEIATPEPTRLKEMIPNDVESEEESSKTSSDDTSSDETESDESYDEEGGDDEDHDRDDYDESDQQPTEGPFIERIV